MGDNLYAIIASYMMGSGPMKREKGKRSGCREALEVWNKKNENWIQRISSLYVGGKRGEKKNSKRVTQMAKWPTHFSFAKQNLLGV